MLANSIRHAGFTPCLSIDQLKTLDRRATPSAVKSLIIELSPGQAFQVNRMSDTFGRIIKIHGTDQIEVSLPMPVHKKRPLLIADCYHAEVHEVQKVLTLKDKLLIKLTKPLFYTYQSPSYVGEWLQEKWQIKPNKTQKNALYYQATRVEEVSDLIHQMSIRFLPGRGKPLLEIVLGLDNQSEQKLLVRVRS